MHLLTPDDGCFTTITRYSDAFQVLVSRVDVHQEYTWPKLWVMQVNWMGRITHVMEADDNHFQVGGHMLGTFHQSRSSLEAWEIWLICRYFAFDIISSCRGGGCLLSYNKIGWDYSDMKDSSWCGMLICVGHIMDANDLCHHCFISCQQFGWYIMRVLVNAPDQTMLAWVRCFELDGASNGANKTPKRIRQVEKSMSAVQGGYQHGSTRGSWRATLLDAWQDAERPRRYRRECFLLCKFDIEDIPACSKTDGRSKCDIRYQPYHLNSC